MVKAIQEHLAQDGKRMTNLSTASIEKLNGFIDKYKIDINSYAIKYKDELKMKRIKDKKDKKERQDEEDERHNECMKRNALINQLCLQLDEGLIIKKSVYVMEIKHNNYWKVNGVKLQEQNDKMIKMVDTEYEKLKKLLPSNAMLERVNETTINVRGIHTDYGGLNEKETSKEWMYEAKQGYGRIKQNLFDCGMLQVLCEDSKYYLNCKREKGDALQKEADELYKSTERTKMLIYYCESLDDELLSLKQACLLELTDKFNWNTGSGSGYGTVGLWKIKNDLYNNCGTLEELWRINQQYVYIQQKNNIKREELENEKMIKEINEYVKNKYPILNKNYKMTISFVKKGAGAI